MDFRAVIFISLWTLLSGPIFSTPTEASPEPGMAAEAIRVAPPSPAPRR